MEQVLIEPSAEGSAAVEVRGGLRSELLRLSGATVAASGARDGRSLRVTDYTIIEVAGREPLVGELERIGRGMALRTAGGDLTRLRDVPAELEEHIGAKVWLLLNANGSVEGYGILRER